VDFRRRKQVVADVSPGRQGIRFWEKDVRMIVNSFDFISTHSVEQYRFCSRRFTIIKPVFHIKNNLLHFPLLNYVVVLEPFPGKQKEFHNNYSGPNSRAIKSA